LKSEKFFEFFLFVQKIIKKKLNIVQKTEKIFKKF